MMFVAERVMRAIDQDTLHLFEDHSRSAAERISALVTALAPHYAAIRSPLMVQDMLSNAPKVWSELERWRRGRYERFRNILDDGVRSGEFRADIPAAQMHAFYTAMVEKVLDPHTLRRADQGADAVYTAFMNLFLRGILTSNSHEICPPLSLLYFHDTDPSIQTTEQLLRDNGYQRTTVDSIARLAGVSKKTLYEHFESKENIVAQVFRVAAQQAESSVPHGMFEHRDAFVSNIHQIVSIYASTLGRFGKGLRDEIAEKLPKVHQHFEEGRTSFLNTWITRSIERGKDFGIVRFDTDVHLTSSAIQVVIDHVFEQDAPNEQTTKLLPELACSIIFYGIEQRTTPHLPQPTH